MIQLLFGIVLGYVFRDFIKYGVNKMKTSLEIKDVGKK